MGDRVVADSWNELLLHVKGFRAELGNPSQLWFRGQGNADFELLPSLLRFANGLDRERALFERFRQLSQRVLPRRTDEDWETLFDMQHYGIPTRLLDWTETLGIAVFFAATYNRFYPGKDAAIFILDPMKLNTYSRIDRVPFIPDDPTLKYRDIYWLKRPFAPNFPIACEPQFRNDRILAQRGRFTIHGDNTSPIDVGCEQAAKRIVLSGQAIREALDFLDIANINESTVFPDLAGVANYIRDSAGLTRPA